MGGETGCPNQSDQWGTWDYRAASAVVQVPSKYQLWMSPEKVTG